MILGTGIDAVDIARFAHWHTKPYHSLQRIFSDNEITYCLSCPRLSAQRFASRFAAREAIYKVCSSIPHLAGIPFLTLVRAIIITHNAFGTPSMIIEWSRLGIAAPPAIKWHLSLTHTHTLAIALVIAEEPIKSTSPI